MFPKWWHLPGKIHLISITFNPLKPTVNIRCGWIICACCQEHIEYCQPFKFPGFSVHTLHLISVQKGLPHLKVNYTELKKKNSRNKTLFTSSCRPLSQSTSESLNKHLAMVILIWHSSRRPSSSFIKVLKQWDIKDLFLITTWCTGTLQDDIWVYHGDQYWG